MRKKLKDTDYYPFYGASEDAHAKTFLIAIVVIGLMITAFSYFG